MTLRKEVIDAFGVLGIDEDADQRTASSAYKRLALVHHPDKNTDDSSSNERFQKIGAAWEVLSKYYDNPSWGDESYLFDDDDDDDDFESRADAAAFFQFLFQQTMNGSYRRARQNFRQKQQGGGLGGRSPFGFVFTTLAGGGHDYSPRDQDNSYDSREYIYPSRKSDAAKASETSEAQKKEQAEYQRRQKQLEEELKREQAEQARLEKERKATAQDRASARERAFAAARRGNLTELQEIVTKYNIDVTASSKNKTETLLLAAAQSGDVSVVQWLVQCGADVDVTRKDGFNVFHIATAQGHAALAKYLLEKHPKSFHPSKALPNGHSPLNLAVHSGSVETTQALVRFAPIPDVTKCWTDVNFLHSQGDSDSDRETWTAILDILRTKKGFQPPGEQMDRSETTSPTLVADEGPAAGEGQSKKAVKKRKQREKAAREAEEAERAKEQDRERRLAEQRARTADHERKEQEQAAALRRQHEALIAEEELALAEATRLSIEQANQDAERRAREKAAEETRNRQKPMQDATVGPLPTAQWQTSRQSLPAQAQAAPSGTAQDPSTRQANFMDKRLQRQSREQWQRERQQQQAAEETVLHRHAEENRVQEEIARNRLELLRLEEQQARISAERAQAELTRAQAERDARLRGGIPPSPPATPEMQPPVPQFSPPGLAKQSSASPAPQSIVYEDFQTAVEADYLFDPPELQWVPAPPEPVIIPEERSVPSNYYRGGRGRGSYRGRGKRAGHERYRKSSNLSAGTEERFDDMSSPEAVTHEEARRPNHGHGRHRRHSHSHDYTTAALPMQQSYSTDGVQESEVAYLHQTQESTVSDGENHRSKSHRRGRGRGRNYNRDYESYNQE